jgi:ACS family hexuronate transporter-like MFS transporter
MICALLFFATTVNYVDRQVLSVLKPMLEIQLNWTEADYGWIVFAFQMAYALMMPIVGRFIDWAGTRLGYALAVLLWSFAAMSHSFARTALQFSVARFALGIGEAANFPAAIRTVADWFPQKERSFATSIFNSGTNVGVVIAALAPFVALRFGWQATFLITGTLGLLWVVPWLLWFRNPREYSGLSKTELAYIESDHPTTGIAKVEYSTLIAQPGAWAFIIGKFVTDPVWWFFLFWIPSFLNRTYRLDLTAIGLPLIIIYVAADVGSIAGGWLFASLVRVAGHRTVRVRRQC